MKLLAATAAGAFALSTAFAQQSSTTTTTTGATDASETTTTTGTLNGSGTITAYTPGSDYITFRTESSTTPVKYYYTKKTVLVDPEGRTVEWTALKPKHAGDIYIHERSRPHGRDQGDASETAFVLREDRNDDNDDQAVIISTASTSQPFSAFPSSASWYIAQCKRQKSSHI